MTGEEKKAFRILTGGIIALAIALGISRFAYTPLLPVMQQDVGFGDDFAGLLASANYAGYLIGALWAIWKANRHNRVRRLRFHLILTITATLGMGLTDYFPLWFALRFVSGATSALVFVLASGLVLEALAQLRRPSWSGWLYAGVGSGIALSAALIPAFTHLSGWRGGWLGLAAVSGFLAWGAWRFLTDPCLPAGTVNATGSQKPQSAPSALLPWLTFAYFCEGLGYIVTGTFLVSWVHRAQESAQAGVFAWLLVGLAAIPSSVLWMKAGVRFGLVTTLILAHLVQACGIMLPALTPAVWGALAGAVFFGGTFLGITALTLVLGRSLAPERSDRVVAVLTAAFGAGQMLGPTVAGVLSSHTDSVAVPLVGAAAVVTLGALILVFGLACTRGAKTGAQVAIP